MKRRFQNGSDSDSLELLLDTLCNMFGGIVLIACLLAILPRQQMPPPLLPVENATAAMLERRVISARDEITRIQSEIERLTKSTDPRLAGLQAQRDSLRRTHDRLLTEIKGRQDREATDADAHVIISQGNPAVLAERLQELKLQKSKSEGIQISAAEKIRFLEQRIANLGEESVELANGRIQAVRFPRERKGESSPLPIILRYNAAYPMVLGEDLEMNPSIKRIPESGRDAFRAEPLRGMGITVADKDLELTAALKTAAAKGYYATLYLYPDSHLAFSKLKEALSNAGLPYGLEFVKPDRDLFFGSEGTLPPEL